MTKIFTKEEFITRARLIEKVIFESQKMEMKPIPIEFNNTGSTFGYFEFDEHRAIRIVYNRLYLKGIHDLDKIDDTIAHELIHYLLYLKGYTEETHGTHFRALYKKITGKSYKSNNPLMVTDVDIERMKENVKYVYVCEGCGQLTIRSRASDFTKNYKHYSCGLCGDEFKRLK